jgi:hypothetical protein
MIRRGAPEFIDPPTNGMTPAGPNCGPKPTGAKVDPPHQAPPHEGTPQTGIQFVGQPHHGTGLIPPEKKKPLPPGGTARKTESQPMTVVEPQPQPGPHDVGQQGRATGPHHDGPHHDGWQGRGRHTGGRQQPPPTRGPHQPARGAHQPPPHPDDQRVTLVL